MPSKPRVPAPAETLAQTLFEQFVEQPIPESRELLSSSASYPMLDTQVRLYHFASVLLAVLDAERRDSAFTPVRESLERCFFPSSLAEGAALLTQVRQAMADLATLIQPKGQSRPESWARDWFGRAGLKETNPATLSLFALGWLDHYVAVAKSLAEFAPV